MDNSELSRAARHVGKCFTVSTYNEKEYHIDLEAKQNLTKAIFQTEAKFVEIGNTVVATNNIRGIDKRNYHEWDRIDMINTGLLPEVNNEAIERNKTIIELKTKEYKQLK